MPEHMARQSLRLDAAGRPRRCPRSLDAHSTLFTGVASGCDSVASTRLPSPARTRCSHLDPHLRSRSVEEIDYFSPRHHRGRRVHELSAHLTRSDGAESCRASATTRARTFPMLRRKALYGFLDLLQPRCRQRSWPISAPSSDLTQIVRRADMLLALSPDADQSFPLQDRRTTPTPATYASLYALGELSRRSA